MYRDAPSLPLDPFEQGKSLQEKEVAEGVCISDLLHYFVRAQNICTPGMNREVQQLHPKLRVGGHPGYLSIPGAYIS